jgi:hypothetical protein
VIRKLLVLAALSLLVSPAAALASTTTNDVAANASKQCSTLRAKIGATSFGQTFASFGACVSSFRPLELKNSNTAAAACRSEQADVSFAANHPGKTFQQFYGTGNLKNAFGKCVSRKARSASAAEQASINNPAQICASLQSSQGAADFAKTYRTNGACVSQTAHATIAAQVSAAASCLPERMDGGAVGRCVAQTAQVTGTAQQQATVARCGGAESSGVNPAQSGSTQQPHQPLPQRMMSCAVA